MAQKEECLDQTCKRAMNKAVSMLQYSERCEYDIRRKLNELSFDANVTERTINKLKEYGYLNDTRYASVYIRSHILKKSRREIAYHLSGKGIADDVIQTAFEEYELPDEETVIRRLLSKKYSQEDLREKKERVILYFVRKGYPYRQVISCIEDALQQ